MMKWIKSNIDYGKSLVDTGVDGARSAGTAMLNGECVGSVLARSAAKAWPSVAIAAGLGVLCTCLATRKKKPSTAIASGLIGGALGFGAGLAWETRRLTGSMARGAMKNVGIARDAHWLSKNPIDYA
jgi:hypothetical protein